MHMMNHGYFHHQSKRFKGTGQDYDDYEDRGHHFPSQHDLDVIENLEILPEFPSVRATVTPPESPFAQQQQINSDSTGFETFTTFDQSSYAYNLSPDAPSFQNYTAPSRYYQLYHHNHESSSAIARPLPIIRPEKVHRTNSLPAQTEQNLSPTQEKPKDMSHHYFNTTFEMKPKGPTKARRPSVEPLSPKEEGLDCYQIPMDFKRTRRNAVFVSRETTIVEPVEQTVAHPKSGTISSQSPRSHVSTKPEIITSTNLLNSNCNGKRALDSPTSPVTSLSAATTTAASLTLAFPAAEAISKTEEDSDPILKTYSLHGNGEITTQKIILSIPDEQQPQRNEHRQEEQLSTFKQSNTPSSSPASTHSAHDALTISAQQHQQSAQAITSARRTPPATNNKQKSPTQSKPGPKPYLPPKILFHDEATGEELLQFEYSINSQKLQFIVTVPPIQLSQLKEHTIDLSKEFKAANAVYPKACLPRDQYKGNRYSYEQETNEVGWILCDANEDLLGQKGLIQRAVDCWRNTRTDERINSRRVKKQKNK